MLHTQLLLLGSAVSPQLLSLRLLALSQRIRRYGSLLLREHSLAALLSPLLRRLQLRQAHLLRPLLSLERTPPLLSGCGLEAALIRRLANRYA